jgi:glycosyltransferase involved in cell wall biosynthesis
VSYREEYLEKAIPYADKYISCHAASKPEEAFEMASKIGEIHLALERWEDSRRAFIHCVQLQPLRAEGFYNLGILAMKRMEQLRQEYPAESVMTNGEKADYNQRLFLIFKEAEKWLIIASETPPPVTSYYLRAPIYTFLPDLKRAELYENLHHYTGTTKYGIQARECYRKVYQQLPFNREVKQSLRRIESAITALTRDRRPADKPRIAIVNTTGQFTSHLAEIWKSRGYDVQTWRRPSAKELSAADVICCAWTDAQAVAVSHWDTDAKLFLRLCRYEAYTRLPSEVNWDNVDGLIVPSRHMKRFVLDRFGVPVPVHVIRHGLPLDRYSFMKRSPGNNVAFVGYLHARKNLMELADIVVRYPCKIFHVAGRVQQQDLWRAFWWKLRESGCHRRVIYYGWVKDIDTWLDDVRASYLLSTSWNESFGYAIAEAMAKGIKPVIREFEGAGELWPEQCLYKEVSKALEMLGSGDYDSQGYRKWIEQRYDAEREAHEYLKLFFGDDHANKQS